MKISVRIRIEIMKIIANRMVSYSSSDNINDESSKAATEIVELLKNDVRILENDNTIIKKMSKRT